MLLLLLFVLQFGGTQTVLAKKTLGWLNQKHQVSLDLKELKISPFGELNIKNLLIKDHHHDTLIYVKDIDANLTDIHKLKNKELTLENVKIYKGWVKDKIYENEINSSLTTFNKKFKTSKKNKTLFKLHATNITVDNIRYLRKNNKNTIVDFNGIKGKAEKLELKGSSINVLTDSLSFKDIYGINYHKLATDFSYSLSEMNFKDTQIITENSNLKLNALLSYHNGNLTNFVENVEIKSELTNSQLSLKDIHKIYPHFKTGGSFKIFSKLTGTLNNLKLNTTEITSEDNLTKIKGDFLLKNSIVNRELFWFSGTKTKIQLRVDKLTNSIPNQYHKNLPRNFYGLEETKFNGDLYVSRANLVLNGSLMTNLGGLNVNGSLEGLNKANKFYALKIKKGDIKTNSYLKDLKNILFEGVIKGSIKKDRLFTSTDLFFNKLSYKQITVSNSRLQLKLLNKDLKATFITNDSLLSFTTNIDYKKTKRTKKEYDVNFEIRRAKLSKLFPKNISYQKNITARGAVKVSDVGRTFLASGKIENFHIETALDSLSLNDVDLNFVSKEKKKEINLKAKNLLNANVYGEFKFSDFEKLVENALYKFIPGSKKRIDLKGQIVKFDLEVYPKFLKSLTDKINLNKTLKASGVLDTNGDKGIIHLDAPSISTQDFNVDNLKIVLDNSNKFINTNLSIDKLKFKKQVYEDLSLLGKKINDTLFVRSNFNTNKIKNRALFHLTTHSNYINLGVEDIYFKYLNSVWINNKQHKNKINFNLNNKNWYFNDISFKNKNQEFDFNGNIEKNDSKNLKLTLRNIDLSEIIPSIDSLKVGGLANGEFFFREKNTLLKPDGNLTIERLKINNVDYGLMKTSIKPNNKKLGYDLKLNIVNNNIKNIDAAGEILVNENKFLASTITLNVLLKDLKLSSLSPLGKNVLSTVRGKANGRFKVTGKLNDFNSHGSIKLINAGLKFPYLNTNYNFVGNTDIDIEGKTFIFNKINLEDSVFKTQGVLKGKINYDKYNNWDLSLRVDTDNLLVLNTEQSETSKYFGTAFMNGFATIKGPTSNLVINVTGRTLPNTKFVLPISDIKQAESNKFIYFKKVKVKEETPTIKKEIQTGGGLSIFLNLDITNDALGEVVIDQTSGSSLLGRVDGRLLIDIDRFFNIKMFGDLMVNQGVYNFKYGGVISKPFIVKRGGTVSWSGDPYKAILNIEAIHRVKANPKVLLESLSVNRKIDVDLITTVKGELFESNQEFFVQIPNASSTVASELDFKINTDKDSKMRQFFSLLISKSFFDENNINSTGAVLSNTTSELISNAVTDIFNSEENNFQINFGYTSGESSDVEDLSIDNQIDIGVATEINERILINGKLGVPVGTSTQSALIGEVNIEFLLNRKGTLRSSIFNRQNEIQYSEEEEGYTQGLGLNYQIDFSNLNEMLQILKLKKKKRKLTKSLKK